MSVKILQLIALAILLAGCATAAVNRTQSDTQAIIATNERIREHYAQQNIAGILQYHDPDVEKVLSWNDHQIGHAAMETSLKGLFRDYRVNFLGRADDMQSLQIRDNTAVMVATFIMQGQPKAATGQSFVFSGRAMIVYRRDARSPTGWLTYREMVVPETK